MDLTRDIVLWPDERLKKPCESVDRNDLLDGQLREPIVDQISQMIAALKKFNAIGIAANQLGYDNRIIAVRRDPENSKSVPVVLINPIILETSEARRSGWEGCLSFPGQKVIRGRPKVVKVAALDMYGTFFKHQAHSLAAACIQHEIDHLNGKTMYDL